MINPRLNNIKIIKYEPMLNTIFLDRDGVINVDSPDYIKTPDEFHFIPGSTKAMALLTAHGFDIILITNQSVINRKMVTPATLDAIFDKLKSGVAAEGGTIKDIFFCPHTPRENCSCRKPLPGLILQAQKKYSLDLKETCMVGDSAKDMLCARNAGCGKSVLVKTGNGENALKTLQSPKYAPDHVVEDLLAAARLIIQTSPR
ncbi:D-alpha,beta-D-heptose 1,7-bisphosphate phosphatase [Desulfocicer vacuolatum DSM 3385]|uniref:D,D-heptose 1,7-bisphosphate phosphatase n=2 Tax=Desulfocicer vacuolatum TaxID=2298 RepID=A0A1W2CAA6_9BACT|nr:D-alpha,beta-D-heptose 1,7-bisphosphate phosphatase [Desulfocicer vacuolatum DSM 3385]